VKGDINGNVKKVQTAFETYKQSFLQDLVSADISENNGKLGKATEGLLWLKR